MAGTGADTQRWKETAEKTARWRARHLQADKKRRDSETETARQMRVGERWQRSRRQRGEGNRHERNRSRQRQMERDSGGDSKIKAPSS